MVEKGAVLEAEKITLGGGIPARDTVSRGGQGLGAYIT